MVHRLFVRVAAMAVAWHGVCGMAQVESPPQFNVLLIISDDLRAELGCYGSEWAKTPNIDALATSGVRFERAYCQFPLCNPSRTSMLTSRQPTATGVLDNRTWFGDNHPDYVSLPRHFQAHGYATLRAGKIFHGGIDDVEAWTEGGAERVFGRNVRQESVQAAARAAASAAARQGESSPRRPQLTKAQRSDRWVVLRGDGESHGDYRTASRAIKLLGKYQHQPFFLGCGFVKPHSPLEAPQRFYDLYDVNAIELPPDFAPRPTVPDGFPRQSQRRNADLFIGRDATPQQAKEMIRAYLASVSFLDANVGRVISELDRLGLRENTIIVFWGDHGYQLGEKGKWSKAGSLFEQTARVPLIIIAPQAAANGRSCPRVVQSIDIYPTLCELCGLPLPEGLEGQSLVPLLAEPTTPWDYPAYTIWSEDGHSLTGVSVRTERWHYVEYDGGRGGVMLLDPAADPHEMHNLADDPELTAVRRHLSALVRAYAAHKADN